MCEDYSPVDTCYKSEWATPWQHYFPSVSTWYNQAWPPAYVSAKSIIYDF